MKKCLITILILFQTLLSYSEHYLITGKVANELTSEPFEGATVFVRSLNINTETDSQGNYSLKLPEGTYVLEAFSLGMAIASKSVTANQNMVVNFYLSELAGNLQEVEVRDSRQSLAGISRLQAVENFGIYEAKKNELIILNDFAANKVNNNARQIFAKVPGLNIWESDFAGLQLDIAARGLGPGRTANFNTRQNGYDMSADALGYPESYYLPAMQAVERIEIVRGAASLQYGTQFGGMLNFRLKEAPNVPFEMNVEQAIGSFGMVSSFASVGGKLNKLDYYGYYQYREGDGWRENSEFEAHTAFAKLGWQANDRLKFGIEHSFLSYKAQQPGGLTDEHFNNGNLEESLRSRNWFRVSWNLLAATLEYRFNERTQFNLKTFGLFSQRDALGNLEQIGVPDNPNESRTLISDKFNNQGSEMRLVHRYAVGNKNSAIVVGARYYNGLTDRKQGDAITNDGSDFEFLTPEDPEEFDYEFPSQNYAFFAENLIDLTSRLSLTSGFRLEHIRTDAEGTWNLNRYDFAGNLISSTENEDASSEVRTFPLFGVGLSYYINDNLSFYSNISQNFRSITFSDLRVVNPNFQLDSLITDERGYNVDLGIRGRLATWLNVDISAFLMRYNDRIGLYELPGSTTLFRTNIGDSRHIGLETFSEVDIWRLAGKNSRKSGLGLFLNMSITEAYYINSDITSIRNRRVEYVPEVMLRTGLNYRYKGLKATYQFSYLGQQFSDATNSTFNPNALTGIIPSYQVMDASVEYNFNQFKCTAGVNNILDEKYFTRRAESYPGPGIIPATPRSFYFSLGFKLDSK
ncbi:TonB-dependent receptor [Fulvivirga lutea]|uniref:TonB-dependent receptor n=1 Tax=Fulvivirga lutea TaxID=2810512 RepID=A0A974ZZJ8_9BACT|nr:TonB-dependent receptor [Fulvivirga lutea]QSE96201.1 TonB-dependent receptor [Fulvivirga lutea]